VNRNKVDKTWQKTHRVTREEAVAYARATNDSNPRYGEVAPPMFAVFLEMPPLMDAVKDPVVIGDPKRFLRLLHGEHDLRWHGPIVPGRTYTTTCSVQSMEEKSSGEVITLRLETKDEGKLVVETTSTMFIRAEKTAEKTGDKPAEAKPAAEAKKAEPARTLAFAADERVAADQSLRYADASGDHNPIHKDPEVAKKAGLPGIILHGLCSMAFCQKAVIDALGGGDPSKLRRLKVRFAKPVLMGQTLQISGWRGDAPAIPAGLVAFEAKVDGAVVIKDGLAEVGDSVA
jgi:acyl dehydratase